MCWAEESVLGGVCSGGADSVLCGVCFGVEDSVLGVVCFFDWQNSGLG